MAYTAGNLHLRAGAPGDLTYTYDAGSDTLATVLVAGYFNNTDDNLVLTVDDLLFVQAGDGNCWARVSGVSSGSVTLQFAGGNLPVQTLGTNTNTATAGDSADRAQDLVAGYFTDGTATLDAAANSTASRYVLAAPYPGAEVFVRRDNSATVIHQFDAGASDATTITFDAKGNRAFMIQNENEYFHVVGVSTTRWRIMNAQWSASIEASAVVAAGASRFPGAS
jgi:hypothetical protein